MDRNPHLKVIEGALAGESYEVTTEGVMVGRGEDCAVRLPDPGVSREHARVFLHNAGVWVQDMGSRNGVFVKGSRISRPKSLSPGTEFTVGDHRFTIALDAEQETEKTAPPVVTISEGPTSITNEPTVNIPSAPNRTPLILGVVGVLLVLGMIAASLFAG